MRFRNKRRYYNHWISREDRLAIYKRDGFACLYCGSTFHLQLDHLHPRSKGGSNHKSNLVTACRACNMAKSNRIIPGRNRNQKIRNFRKERLGGRTERQRYRNASRKKMKYRPNYYTPPVPPVVPHKKQERINFFWVVAAIIVIALLAF